MPLALITGGSAGIGDAFARHFAAAGHDLVLVARDAGRLRRAATEHRTRHGVAVQVIVADLATAAGRLLVEQRVADRALPPVDVLVNNAAREAAGIFPDVAREDVQAEIDLNITAVLRLTHAALPGMLARRTGSVINVGSMAGYLPSVGSCYGPTKAWVSAFTDSLCSVLTGSGVRAIALCPGYVRTGWTDPAGGAGLSGALLWADPDDVVRRCLRDLSRGLVVSAPGPVYRPIVRFLELPRTCLRALSRAAGVSREHSRARVAAAAPVGLPTGPAVTAGVSAGRLPRFEAQRVDLTHCARPTGRPVSVRVGDRPGGPDRDDDRRLAMSVPLGLLG